MPQVGDMAHTKRGDVLNVPNIMSGHCTVQLATTCVNKAASIGASMPTRQELGRAPASVLAQVAHVFAHSASKLCAHLCTLRAYLHKGLACVITHTCAHVLAHAPADLALAVAANQELGGVQPRKGGGSSHA
eukprot:1160474-Pelagomonas_calceolata.AAC.4